MLLFSNIITTKSNAFIYHFSNLLHKLHLFTGWHFTQVHKSNDVRLVATLENINSLYLFVFIDCVWIFVLIVPTSFIQMGEDTDFYHKENRRKINSIYSIRYAPRYAISVDFLMRIEKFNFLKQHTQNKMYFATYLVLEIYL